MAVTNYSIESKTTREIREERQKSAERHSTMTNEEIMAEQREARMRLNSEGFIIPIRDPRTEHRN